MSLRNEECYEHFESLRKQARKEVNRGNWQAALALFDEAVLWAEELGDRNDRDLAHCNRAGILIAPGHGEEVVGTMRQILLSSPNPDICYHAAYNISRFHEFRKESERGLFYARLCLDHAKRSKQSEAMARGHNQIGHLLVRDSYFEEARESYQQALSLISTRDSADRSIILTNIGYCQIILGRHTQGFTWLFESLRIARRCQAEAWQMMAHLGLSYAYLEIDRPRRARTHAHRGLLLAEEVEISWQIKNALYLLGESEKLSGNELTAHRYFSRLQREFYPDDPVIPDFLMATDVRKLINLLA